MKSLRIEVGRSRSTLHEARHTYASFGIAAGLNAKTLSTYMGHASISITLDLYGHLFPGSEVEATNLLDAYFARRVRDSRAVVDAPSPAVESGSRAVETAWESQVAITR